MANTMLQIAFDGFKNFVAELGTGRDKNSAGTYVENVLSDIEWDTVYRVSWMGRKIVDIPAEDATRRWRDWQGDTDQCRLIKEEENRLCLPKKVQLGMKQGRLYGGAGIYISIKGDDPALELRPETVGKGDLEFIVNLTKDVLEAGPIDFDPMSVNYGMPRHYDLRSSGGDRGSTRVHPSRIIIFKGNELLNPELASGAFEGWGESVLTSAHDAVMNADATASNITSLVYEAKCDVLQIPNLADIMSDPRQRELLVQRVTLASKLKGNNGMLVLDTEEEYNHRAFQFAGLPEINRQALQAVSGAADIPITRFLGQTPSGLSSTGESDLKNYYDSVSSMQELELTPALAIFDECLIRSAIGSRPEEIYYDWASLWQMSDTEKTEITEKLANALSVLSGTGLFPSDALSDAGRLALADISSLPEMQFEIDEAEAAWEEAGAVTEEQDDESGPEEKDVGDAKDQPRDNKGRWASTGGGGSFGSHAGGEDRRRYGNNKEIATSGDRTLTDRENSALNAYVDDDYEIINEQAWTGEDLGAGDEIAAIDSAIAARTTTTGGTTYHGMTGEAVASLRDQGALESGAEIEIGGYLSTTPDFGGSKDFTNLSQGNESFLRSQGLDNPGAVVRITVPKGANALNMREPLGGINPEAELLFPRGTKLRVVGTSKHFRGDPFGEGTPTIYTELVQPGD